MQRSKTYLPPAALQALLVMKRHLAQMNFLLFEKQSMKTELFHAPEYWCNGGAGGYRWGQPIWVSITASKWFSVGKKKWFLQSMGYFENKTNNSNKPQWLPKALQWLPKVLFWEDANKRGQLLPRLCRGISSMADCFQKLVKMGMHIWCSTCLFYTVLGNAGDKEIWRLAST